jgi:hypothetical protein
VPRWLLLVVDLMLVHHDSPYGATAFGTMTAGDHAAGVIVASKPAMLLLRLPGGYGTLDQLARVPMWTVTRPDGNARGHVFHEPTKSRRL